MSILSNSLQNDLINLSTEARRKHPEIKEVFPLFTETKATERLIYILRALKERPSTPGVDIVAQGIPRSNSLSELAKSDESIKPFVLSLATKNVKLVPIAIGCLQKMISHHAVPDVFYIH
jgi:hypothetical protein